MRDPKPQQNTKKKQIYFLFHILLHIPNPASTQPTHTAAPFRVGLILDIDYPIGQIALTSIKIAIADFYNANANSTKHLVAVQRDSSSSVLTAASSALELITGESVHAILGPDTASEVAFVADLGAKANVPIISYSVTSKSVAPCCFHFFVRAAPSDALQVQAIAALVHEYGWRRVVPIYEDDDHGVALLPFLVDALDNVEAVIPYRCGIRFSATDDHISSELYRLQKLQIRVFVIHTCVQLAGRIFTIANRIGMMSEGYVWILTEGLTSLLGWIESKSVHGVLGVSTQIPVSEKLNGFKRRWTRQFLTENPDADPSRVSSELSNYAVWAYDAAWALALAAEHLGPVTNSTIRTSNGYDNLSTLVVSDTGKSLLQALLHVQFDGLGGKFHLVNGELNMTKACRIVNVVDGKAQEIGVWTQNEGLKRRLRPVIWPGESMVVPKGWDVTTIGKRLRLAVPGSVAPGFKSFLNLKVDKTTNRILAKGFVFDMFEAAVRQLPYALLFDYVPVEHVNYDSLVELVANGSYDGIVADMTLTVQRSMSVDFTQPYKQSGISILAPEVTDKGSRSAWVFIKPLEPNLWAISGAFFIFTGIIIWLMEHRVNQEFRGPWWRHHGTIVSFSLSTLSFSHSERIVSNFSRVTLIVWLFVVFILTSSYTANLSSMLTVKQLKPSVSDINDLKYSAASIGYLQHSFVKDNLLKLGFDKSRLLPLKSPQEYAEALACGRVAAIVDETPYLEVFINDHCDGYEMSSEIYKTAGFGFAFPKGSMLAADLSKAILKITETGQSYSIQQKWFEQNQNTCSSGDSSASSKQIGLDSFQGLFCITGAISGLCCIIFVIKFYIQNKDELKEIVANNPWRTSLHEIWKFFYEAADETSNSSRASNVFV
ncbi:glutamate receptor 2.8-like isoform X1 [Carex rostrata]